MNTRALIGHTGFVGSNLLQSGYFDGHFNSKNSDELIGRYFDEIVCAGVSAVKWQANKDPEKDWAGISKLINNLKYVRCKKFILISTVDVYQNPNDVTEEDVPDIDGSAYGVHRARLEKFIIEFFPNNLIVRLPALYGRGLKKNAIYDLKNNNMIESIHPLGRFQWYDVRRLDRDLQNISKTSIKLINITAEPVTMITIGDKFFPGKLSKIDSEKIPINYNVCTKHAEVLGGSGSYHFTSSQVLDGIENYLLEAK